ncbi:Hsp20/alpha crystallin family protein [Salarchaeum japonicum]|uniref:SHSP domain-containing protein n=1 Tax=Salarchaeum japonicum TaxID=555573 RepID=A0AAV3T136_9EURY|nr:Hsp20/alpha crystallin family protein [Salarchaeum japonicum]
MKSSPFDEMDRMFEQMDRAFDDMRARWSNESGDSGVYGGLHGLTHDWQTTDDAHTLVVDLPGFEREELDVHAEDGVVVIDAEHEADAEHGVRGRRVHERLSLPADADVENVQATYRNGVLELAFGRTHESGRRIDIQ